MSSKEAKEAEAAAKREAEEKARAEAEAAAKREAEEKARAEAEAAAKREADEKARAEAEAAAKREADEKAKAEALAQAAANRQADREAARNEFMAKLGPGPELNREQTAAANAAWNAFNRQIPYAAQSAGQFRLSEDEIDGAKDYGIPNGVYRVVGVDWLMSFVRGCMVEANRATPETDPASYRHVPQIAA